MDFRLKNILPSKKIFLGSDEDLSVKINLSSQYKNLEQYDKQTILNISDQFEQERNGSNKYKISLTINHLSLLNQLTENPENINDLFDITEGDCTKNFLYFKDYFDVFICYLSELIPDVNNEYYGVFKPLTTVNDVDIINCGFYQNLFTDKIYQCIVNKTIDVTGLETKTSNDRFKLPITDLYVFFRLKNLDQNYYQHVYNKYSFGVVNTQLGNINDTILENGVLGYKYIFDVENYSLTENFEYKNSLKFILPSDTTNASIEYSPFIKIPILEYSNKVETFNITDVDDDQIPEYAYLLTDNTNDNLLERNENYSITSTIFYSGTTRLQRTDPINQTPRKLIYDTNRKKFIYFLDRNVYRPENNLKILKNGLELNEGVDYVLPCDNIYNEVYLNFTPSFGDVLGFSYKYGENYRFRTLRDKGFIDIEDNVNLNYPFLNSYHYIYDNINFINEYNFDDQNTSNIFFKFIFQENNDFYVNDNNFTSGDNC